MYSVVFAVLIQLVAVSQAPDPYYNYKSDVSMDAFREHGRASNINLFLQKPALPPAITVVAPQPDGVDIKCWITPLTLMVLTVIILLAVLMYLFCNAQRKVELSNLAMSVNSSVQKNNCVV